MIYIGKEVSSGVISYPGLTYTQYTKLIKIVPGYPNMNTKERMNIIKREWNKGTI